jgi:hypothetical protein
MFVGQSKEYGHCDMVEEASGEAVLIRSEISGDDTGPKRRVASSVLKRCLKLLGISWMGSIRNKIYLGFRES